VVALQVVEERHCLAEGSENTFKAATEDSETVGTLSAGAIEKDVF
jgi:hypothetical protein